ncbi:Shedu immune nuclease family protein [Curtobacterium sp. MCLR17_039]|uniref:Shedu immune nuclease family protein n=1 Tax=Curtobacterium sp. MCLR17_039 TaxID=2175624 RepID=UPI0015E89DAA|nr:Shedu immune nuclease family protein [Curtobacterium sp. MCLR17_039]
MAEVKPDLILDEELLDQVLTETPLTRTIFRAVIHAAGVRGWIIKQKRARGEEWHDSKAIDFRSLKSGEGVKVELSTNALARLLERYDRLRDIVEEHGVRLGEHEYVSGDVEQVIVAGSKTIAASIKTLLDAGEGEDFWTELATNHPKMLRRLADGAVHEDRRAQLELFESFLVSSTNLKTYAAGEGVDSSKDEKIWQYFFEQNPWIFGYGLDYQYLNILQREATVGSPTVGGSEQELVDYLMGASEYTVLVELKTAGTPLFATNQNRSNSWRLSNSLILAESQILEQKASFQAFADKQAGGLYGKRGNKITQATLNPKVILVIGNKAELEQADSDLEREIKSRTLELHRRDSGSITILTFDELHDRARHIVDIGSARLG